MYVFIGTINEKNPYEFVTNEGFILPFDAKLKMGKGVRHVILCTVKQNLFHLEKSIVLVTMEGFK